MGSSVGGGAWFAGAAFTGGFTGAGVTGAAFAGGFTGAGVTGAAFAVGFTGAAGVTGAGVTGGFTGVAGVTGAGVTGESVGSSVGGFTQSSSSGCVRAFGAQTKNVMKALAPRVSSLKGSYRASILIDELARLAPTKAAL